MAPKLVYIVTEDWYFTGHRLPMAQAAQAAGFEVHVIARVEQRGAKIESLGFKLHPMTWSRRSLAPGDALRAVTSVRALLREIRPVIVHNVALKPAFIGSLACTGLGIRGVVNSINGLGSAFLSKSWRGLALQRGLGAALPVLLNGANVMTIVQNPDDQLALEGLGVRPSQVVLIPGSGVDIQALFPRPEPVEPPIRIGFLGRMLEDKGVRPLVEAQRILRREGLAVDLVLAGTPDPENPTSISESELRAWSELPGISWLGHVSDVQEFWAQNHIAVLPSRREGLPKSLLEAAACGRPMVATDVPGCREVCIGGETGLLVPVDHAVGLAAALRTLASDRALRARLGAQARQLAQSRFSSAKIGRDTAALYVRLAAA